jgi:HD-like signal output (HDOD) protein
LVWPDWLAAKVLFSTPSMARKNILLAIADPQTVVDINQALGDEWLTTPVASEADALALLEAGSFDALLVDFNLGEPDASELLNQALEKCPDTTRFLFAYEADLALVAAKVLGAHEILPKPVEAASLRGRIESGLDDSGPAEAGVATGFDTASSIPSVYDEVLQALNSPDATSRQVGEIIAGDAALTQEILKLTRSAYLGLPGRIIRPVEAVEVLGLDTVKALVMALRFLAEHSHVRPGYLSLETIWQHSIHVGQIARDLVLFETKDRAVASQALAAGLLHDLGKVVLATNFDDLYGRVHSLARKQPVALWDVEKEMFGANHGEIGACLLGMWNLPGAIVEAAALHHEPPLGEHDHLTPLAAVHIANVLEHQLHPGDEFRVVPVVSAPFLNQLGLLQRLPVWRAAFANQLSQAGSVEVAQPGAAAPGQQGGPASWTANHLPGPAAATQTATASSADEKPGGTVPASRPSLRRWACAGFAAAALFSLALILRVGPDSDEPAHVRARTASNQKAVVPASTTSSLATAPTATPQTAPVTAMMEEAPAVNDSPLPGPAIVSKAIEAIATSVPPASLPLAPAPKPLFRINGIFYTAANPSAIVNGETVHAGEQVNGATVIRISRDEVTLEINGERKTLSVPGAGGGY